MKRRIPRHSLLPRGLAAILLATGPAAGQVREDPDPAELLAKVSSRYRAMPAYASEGTVETHIIDLAKGTESSVRQSFTVRLRRDGRYRITWSHESPGQQGAVWNDGERGPRLYQGPDADVVSFDSDRAALAAATGPSLQAAYFVPHLFYGFGRDSDPVARLRDPRYVGCHEVEGQPCFVIAATLSDTIDCRLWIATNEVDVLRVENAFGAVTGRGRLPVAGTARATTALDAAGVVVDEERRRQVGSALSAARAKLQALRGRTVQTHRNIRIEAGDGGEYHYRPPAAVAPRYDMVEPGASPPGPDKAPDTAGP